MEVYGVNNIRMMLITNVILKCFSGYEHVYVPRLTLGEPFFSIKGAFFLNIKLEHMVTGLSQVGNSRLRGKAVIFLNSHAVYWPVDLEVSTGNVRTRSRGLQGLKIHRLCKTIPAKLFTNSCKFSCVLHSSVHSSGCHANL